MASQTTRPTVGPGWFDEHHERRTGHAAFGVLGKVSTREEAGVPPLPEDWLYTRPRARGWPERDNIERDAEGLEGRADVALAVWLSSMHPDDRARVTANVPELDYAKPPWDESQLTMPPAERTSGQFIVVRDAAGPSYPPHESDHRGRVRRKLKVKTAADPAVDYSPLTLADVQQRDGQYVPSLRAGVGVLSVANPFEAMKRWEDGGRVGPPPEFFADPTEETETVFDLWFPKCPNYDTWALPYWIKEALYVLREAKIAVLQYFRDRSQPWATKRTQDEWLDPRLPEAQWGLQVTTRAMSPVAAAYGPIGKTGRAYPPELLEDVREAAVELPEWADSVALWSFLLNVVSFHAGGGPTGEVAERTVAELLQDRGALARFIRQFGKREAKALGRSKLAQSADAHYQQLADQVDPEAKRRRSLQWYESRPSAVRRLPPEDREPKTLREWVRAIFREAANLGPRSFSSHPAGIPPYSAPDPGSVGEFPRTVSVAEGDVFSAASVV